MITRRGILTLLASMALAAFGLAFQGAAASAAPAAPVDIPATQPDGTTFTARAWGDERQHGLETLDGYTILRDEQSGYWVYATAKDGALAPARSAAQQMLVVGRDAPAGLQLHARPAAPVEDGGSLSLSPALAGVKMAPNIGNQPLLVIFVNFTDVKRSTSLTNLTTLNNKIFGPSSSIKDFYAKASFGSLNINAAADSQTTNPSGIVEVTVDFAHPGDGYVYSEEIAEAALAKADQHVIFADFDTDNDKYITSAELHVLLIVAGYEESYCYGFCPQKVTWAHQETLTTPFIVENNIKIGALNTEGEMGGYFMVGELHGFGGASNRAATIGIMAHELGHDLTWPDLYDTDGTSEGVGRWSLMGTGSWNGLTQDGDTPALPDAWAKWYQGWITTPTQMTNGTHALLQASQNASVLLLGNNPGGVDWDFTKKSGTGEYWLLENRQQDGYDAALPGCGILIWHIDETAVYTNFANADEDEPLVGLEQADGERDLYHSLNRGDAGDPYPGSANNTRFSPWSNPRSTYYSGASNGKTVTVTTTTCAASMSVTAQDFTAPTLDNKLFLPVVNNLQPLTGRVTYRGAAVRGQIVVLYASVAQNIWSEFASTVTDSRGNYTFNNIPSLDEYAEYGVSWYNDASNPNYLEFWDCDALSGLSSDNPTCNIELSNVTLSAPAAGASINLPYTFRWSMRPVAGERYAVDFMDPNTFDYWQYELSSRTSSWTMTGLPDGMETGTEYQWDVWVFGPNGYGGPFFGPHYRSVYFNDRSSPPFSGGQASAGEWITHPQRRGR